MKPPRPSLTRHEWSQIVSLTAAAVALFLVIRRLPTGTNLAHTDFAVAGENSIQFCDPANPQFLPVVAVPSPVTMTLSASVAERDRPQDFTLTLSTITGKSIGPADLAVAHTRKLHLMVVDPSLRDYHHLHPQPGDNPGDWRFNITPRRAGLHRVFADFVPLATGRGLYAVAEFTVPGAAEPPERAESLAAERDGYHFSLTSAQTDFRAREVIGLQLAIERTDGGPVPLGTVMGAFAHVVAFDEQRLGFAHLHPQETDLNCPPESVHPRLTFKVTLPEPGRYIAWAQVNLAGEEVFAPFTLQVK